MFVNNIISIGCLIKKVMKDVILSDCDAYNILNISNIMIGDNIIFPCSIFWNKETKEKKSRLIKAVNKKVKK